LALVDAPVSYPYFERFREQRDMFAGASAFQQVVAFNVAIEGAKDANKERIFGHIVSPEYFPVLGATLLPVPRAEPRAPCLPGRNWNMSCNYELDFKGFSFEYTLVLEWWCSIGAGWRSGGHNS